MVKLFCFLLVSLGAVTIMNGASAEETKTALEYSMKSLDGKSVDLKDYKGKVVLVVNTASKCGLTGQYAGLQKLHEKYKDKGLMVLGFPCNQFGGQEPGSAKEISTFCTTKYNVTFDMFEKIDVKGSGACDLYKQLSSLDLKPKGKGDVSWNFEKFLIDRDGKPVARFAPTTSPDAEEIVEAIETLLEAK